MSTIAVEPVKWPIVVVTFPNEITDDDMLSYFEKLRELRSRGSSYALVIDITESQPLTPMQRKMQADYIAEESKLEKLDLKAVAFVAPSAVHRGILTAIFWLHKSPVPHRAFQRLGDAVVWAREMVASPQQRVR